MRLAVVGSRGFDDYERLSGLLDILHSRGVFTSIVSGGAYGADGLARKYANERGLKIVEYLPDWDKHGRSAGYIRNTEIWANADLGIAFWDGKSKGTSHSFAIAEKLGKKLYIYNYVTGNFYTY